MRVKEWLHCILPIYITKFFHKKTVFLVLTPHHGNMGDHAIAKGVMRLLDQAGISYYEITIDVLSLLRQKHKLGIMNGSCILVNGGGNLGTLWPWVEKLFRDIIETNPRSTILCMPNTVYYEDSDWGHADLKHSLEVYNSHKHLKLYAREKISFDFMKPLYRDVTLIPDIVLSMNESDDEINRKGCLLCLRHDKEKTRTEQQEKQIVQAVHDLFGENVFFTDMDVGHPVSSKNREQVLEQKYKEFKQAELVITDRLHGMLFAAITGTPCIVFESKSPKIRGCYDWITDLDYITLTDSPEEIKELYPKMPKGTHHYRNDNLLPYFQKLQEDIYTALQDN